MLNSCFNSRLILDISQTKGLRDPKYGYTFEPFVFIECMRALPGETGVLGVAHSTHWLKFLLSPPVWAASAEIGQVASRD